MKKITRALFSFVMAAFMAFPLAACGNRDPDGDPYKLDPKNPVTINVWHYYNGAIQTAFAEMLTEFNETVGMEKGIIVEHSSHSNVSVLENAVLASARGEVGSKPMPDIFASYADTAYAAEKLGLLANLGSYFTEAELGKYVPSYIEEGRIGLNGELRILPTAKSTEIFMINETDWLDFAEDRAHTYSDLSTCEGIAAVAKDYYEWTDAKTPGIANDGKAFFGRDSMANFFIIASKEFDTEIFQVAGGVCTLNVNETVMRKIWDCYYVPYVSGYFSSYGSFRSDDVKVGKLLSYVGSTSSASYFPVEVTPEGETKYPVTAKVLPVPHFTGGKRVMVQQGAGMVVTKSDPKREYASSVFLKWFTDPSVNVLFSARSGYMPVKKEAIDYDLVKGVVTENGLAMGKIADDTLKLALSETKTSTLYTSKAFDGGAAARAVLDTNLQNKAKTDRAAVIELIEGGSTHAQAVAQFNTDAKFTEWLNAFKAALEKAIDVEE